MKPIRTLCFFLTALFMTACSSQPTQAQAPAEGAAVPAAQTAQAPAPAADAPASPAGLLAVGAEMPDVSAPTQDGSTVALKSLRGKPVVVYFYPKDDTPGCTVEAKGFRDAHAQYEAAGAVVLGVSLDDTSSHKAFAEKYALPFSLLADTNGEITRAFGVKARGGFAQRVTFLMGRDGKVAKVWQDVDVQAHASDVLAAIAALPKG
jgi:peroxiredoxin Q/BCP